MSTTAVFVPAGQLLTVTSTGGAIGSVVRLPDSPGGSGGGATTIIASGDVTTFGPYALPAWFNVISTGGILGYTLSILTPVMVEGVQTITGAKTFNPGTVTAGGSGTASGTGVVATEDGFGAYHTTLLTLTALSVVMTDAGAAGSQGKQKVYTFPAGPIQILGASYNLTTLAGAGGIGDTAALVGSLGTVTVGVDNATLTSTEADLIASTSGTLTAGAGVLAKHGSLVAAAYDGHTTPTEVYLNLAVPDAGSSADDTIAVTGTIRIHWLNLGDY